jgi:predicted nuclease with TOPRIM domain
MKTRNDLVREGSKTVTAKNAIRQVDELKSIIAQMREQKQRPEYINEIEAQGLHSIKMDALTNSKMELERINNRIAQLEKEYSKKLKETDRSQLELINTRYRAMSDKELDAEAMKYISKPQGNDPLQMDYLSAELHARGNDKHSILRDKLVQADYLRPYLFSDEGKALVKEQSFYTNAKPDLFLIEGTNQAGKSELMAASIEGLYRE